MNEIKTAYENYLKERRETILHYNVKYEYDIKFSQYDRGDLTIEEFAKIIEKDPLFSNKWMPKK